MENIISEEEFDGFYVVQCPYCHRSKNKSYFKKGEMTPYCPVCHRELGKENIIKTIRKKINGIKDRCSSIVTEEASYFNY